MNEFANFPRISTFLWFDNNADEAVDFYCSIFKNSRRLNELRNIGNTPGPEGDILTIAFELDGQKFTALNGGPSHKFTEAISLVISCDSQEEVDHYWEKLTANGGEESQCGWLKDKYGLSWQVTPRVLIQLIQNPDKEKANRVFQAMLTMKKIEIPKLMEAAEQQ